jgi:hypothetical protein
LDFRNQRFDVSSVPAQIPPAERDMKKEENRLKTFRNSSCEFSAKNFISVECLAAEGFFFLMEADRVKCAFCKGILREWEVGESPREAHRSHYSTCPFVLHLNVGNVPIQRRNRNAR